MTRPEAGDEGDGAGTIRLDRWLFFARFCKSRGVAADLIGKGRIRVNGQPVSRPGRLVRPGDVLTLPLGGRVRLIRVDAPGTRRGPAPEAQGLYTDLDAATGDTPTRPDRRMPP